MSDVHGDHPPLSPEEIAIIRGWAAQNHRQLHHAKNASADRGERDAISDEMRRIEDLSKKLGEFL